MSTWNKLFSQPYKVFHSLKGNPFRLFDLIVSPILLLFSVALLAVFLKPDSNVFAMILFGTIGWRAMFATQGELLTVYLDEHWSETKMMLFASPLKTSEFILGATIAGLMKFFVVFLIMYAAIIAVFNVFVPINLVSIGSLILLLAYGVALGLLSVAASYLYGQSAFPFAFQLSTFFSLGSGAYYSITIFPQWLQNFLLLIPSTHAFNGLKSVYGLASINWLYAILITLIWLIICWKFHDYAYEKARREGKLASLGS